MSIWGKLFGNGKEKRQPTPQEAIQRLREVEELLGKKSAFLEKKIEEELSLAKKHGKKNQKLALHALKRKKRYEKQLEQIDGTLSTIEFQREALENASTNVEVLTVMNDAAKALKASHKHMDVDKVHDLMDDVQEQQQIAQEISDAISNPVGFNQDVDEDDLLKELEDLEQQALDEQLLEVREPTRDELPSVPTAEPVAAARPVRVKAQASDEDDDMKQLAAWAT